MRVYSRTSSSFLRPHSVLLKTIRLETVNNRPSETRQVDWRDTESKTPTFTPSPIIVTDGVLTIRLIYLMMYFS